MEDETNSSDRQIDISLLFILKIPAANIIFTACKNLYASLSNFIQTLN